MKAHQQAIRDLARQLVENNQTITFDQLARRLVLDGVRLPDGRILSGGRAAASAISGSYNAAQDINDREAIAISYTNRNGHLAWKD
jgi:hypothetical protein